MSQYSTREAAKRLGIHLVTLQNYIAEGKVQAPAVTRVGGVHVRLWTDADIKRVRKTLPKVANGRKTRWQKLREKRAAPAGVPVPHKKTRNKKK
jgi:excisionase family DNA binding protein